MEFFNIIPGQPRRTLFWGPVATAKTSLLGLGIQWVSRQKLRHLTFVPHILYKSGALQHSRTGITFPASSFETLAQAEQLVNEQKPQVVFIEEIQFVEELPAFLDFLSSLNITVIMTGLNSRDDGQPWPVVRDIIHTCNVVQMPGICHMCGATNALYSRNVSGQSSGPDHVLLDTTKQQDHDIFRPTCYKCFFAK